MIGVLVISHGSRREDWVALVDEAVASVGASLPVPVYSSFLEIVEDRLIQNGIDTLEALGVTDLIVVPLFVSSGSTHVEEIAWALGVKTECGCETDLQPFRLRARVHLCRPVDADEQIIDIVYDKIAPLSTQPANELVLVVGHGSILRGFHTTWRNTLEKTADGVRRRGGFAASDGVMLLPDQVAWKLSFWRKRHPELQVIVAPLFLSEGYFTETVIPQRFAGYDVRYNGRALLPNSGIAEWMKRRITTMMEELGTDGQKSETHL